MIKLFQYVYGYVDVELGVIADILRGGSLQKKDFVTNGNPCIHYGQIYTRYGLSTNEALTFVNNEIYDRSRKAKYGDIVMAVTSENIEDVCKCVVWFGNKDVAVSGHTAIIQHNQNAKYLAYYFQSTMFYKQKEKLAHGTKVIEITPDRLNNIIIPLLTLEKQQMIVESLDKLYSYCYDLSQGLPAEIEARQKQYEYYREKTLDFKEK